MGVLGGTGPLGRIAGFAGALLLTVGVAVATGAVPGSSDGEVHFCWADQSRGANVRAIDHEAGERCRSSEQDLVMNQQGPPGEPGPKGDGVQTIAGFVDLRGGRGEGGGFTSEQLGEDSYSLTFPKGTFAGSPILTVSPVGELVFAPQVEAVFQDEVTENWVAVVRTRVNSAIPHGSGFNFIAVEKQ